MQIPCCRLAACRLPVSPGFVEIVRSGVEGDVLDLQGLRLRGVRLRDLGSRAVRFRV